VDQSNVIDLSQYRKLRKHRIGSFAFRAEHDESVHIDALMLLIVTCSIGIISFFLIFYILFNFFN